MEDLNKHQLILLTLLISFVTSIGTGVITFTLLQEAPIEVTQTINRVVERTIEQVAPTVGQPEKTVTTVVVSEDDRVLEAIAKNEKSIVRFKSIGVDGSEIFSGIGVVISGDGFIVADSRTYYANPSDIVFYDSKVYPVGKIFNDTVNGLVFMKVGIPKNDNSKYVFYPATFGNSDGLKIGQTLIAISGQNSNAASVGRVYQLPLGADKKTMASIVSDIKISKVNLGSPVVNLSGEIVGIEAPSVDSDAQYSYIPINIVKSAVTKASAELSK